MAKDNVIIGLDIGSSNIRAVIAQDFSEEETLRVVGAGTVASAGIRQGMVVDIEEAAKAVNNAIETAEKTARTSAETAVISVGGIGINLHESKGVVAVGRADGEVTDDDINRSIEAAQAISMPPNREIIHVISKNYRLDEQERIKDPLGMNGVRLESNTLIVEGSSSHIKNLTKCVHQAGIKIDDMILGSLAAAKAVLNKKQKELGVVFIDIGGGTTSLAVFEEGELAHVSVIPVGASHITNDIAIGLRTSIETAEKVKLKYGSIFPEEIGKKEEIDLFKLDSQEEGTVLRRHVAEIIEARMEEIFDLVNKELKSIGKAGLLPAGAVITGGGAKLPQMVEFAKESLGLPAQIGFPARLGGILDKVDDPSFATAIGLILWEKEQNFSKAGNFSMVKINMENVKGKVMKWIEKFLP